MKKLSISYVSDLHLDMGKIMPVLPGGDVLILAGDICEATEFRSILPEQYKYIKTVQPKDMSLKQRINLFLLEECSQKYKHVIMVAGNHEHYNGTFDKTIQHIRDNTPNNFRVLDNDCFEVDDVLFMGATMWTDCNKGDPLTIHALRYGMNDYEYIKKIYGTNQVGKLIPSVTIEEHEKTLAYFKLILDNPKNALKKVVIVTHHAPTSLSVTDRYKDDHLMNGGYHSKLDDFILDNPQIKYWVHGHTHHKHDYMVGDYTRVLCNPRGYEYYNEETGWDPTETIEL